MQLLETQAKTIIFKLGGAERMVKLAAALNLNLSYETIMRWTRPVPKGGGGIIPSAYWRLIFLLARYEGVYISSNEIDIRRGDKFHGGQADSLNYEYRAYKRRAVAIRAGKLKTPFDGY